MLVAANKYLQLQMPTLQQQLYFFSCKNERQFCGDKINIAATKYPPVFAAAKLAENLRSENDLWSQIVCISIVQTTFAT